ncbi:MAG: tRNA (N6-threonylcarbamoyladenosine(37)-N6)-methyltransferase TrmO [Desulfobacterales bacterium]
MKKSTDEKNVFTFETIGIIRSCFKEKFGIPRQPGLVSEAGAVLEIFPSYDREEAFRGLEDFSHIWIVFVFHASLDKNREKWRPAVRPPRLGGNTRIGVFATRSGFRPSPIGISAVRLEKISRDEGKTRLFLKGTDLLDGTPVLDIKPYLPYADSIPQAQAGFASDPPREIPVIFSDAALETCLRKEREGIPGFHALISQMLGTDPRPAYYSRNPKKNIFGTRIFDTDIRWKFENETITVLSIEILPDQDS